MIRSLILLAMLASVGPLAAQAPDTPAEADPAPDSPAPATRPASGELSAKVVSVAGPAQYLDTAKDNAEWQPLRQGQVLGGQVVIRTGFQARVELLLADRGSVVIEGVAKMGLSRLGKIGDQAQAEIGLKYGRIRAKVRPEAGPSDMEVTTPVATLSVRGSEADICYLVGNRALVKTRSGRWRISKRLGARREQTAGWVRRMMLLAGQSTDSKLQSPERLRLLLWDTELFDKFGITPVERMQMVSNGQGRRYGNAPPGRLLIAPTTDPPADPPSNRQPAHP